jgi:hypothetical protein
MDKLIKILSLTSSDNDAEALSAIRMANSLIKSKGLTWEEIIARPARPKIPKPRAQFFTEGLGEVFEQLFMILTLDEHSGDYNFLSSVYSFYKRGTITLAQAKIVRKIYDKYFEE